MDKRYPHLVEPETAANVPPDVALRARQAIAMVAARCPVHGVLDVRYSTEKRGERMDYPAIYFHYGPDLSRGVFRIPLRRRDGTWVDPLEDVDDAVYAINVARNAGRERKERWAAQAERAEKSERDEELARRQADRRPDLVDRIEQRRRGRVSVAVS